MRTKILSLEEASNFLTDADLRTFEKMINEARLKTIVEEGQSPYVALRGQYISMFDVMTLIGKL